MLLAINTSTLQFSIALVESSGATVGEYTVNPVLRHYGNMFPALDFLLASTSHKMEDLNAIAVAIGPGSFTGLRVGISSALGFSYALGLPLIGIDSLHALAYQVPHCALPIIAMIESRREEVFVAKFLWNKDQGLTRESEDLCLPYRSLSQHLEGPALIIGNNFEKQKEFVGKIIWPGAKLAPSHLWNLRASSIGSLAAHRLEAKDFDDPLRLSPLYLRPPDIRPNPYFAGGKGPVKGH